MEAALAPTHRRRIGLSTGLALALALGGVPAAHPARAAHPETSVRPDLSMLAPTDFSVQKGARGQRLLRFDAVVVNLGPGPFEVYGQRDLTDPPGTYRVVQRIAADSGGSWAYHPTSALMSYSGDGHNHFHVIGLQDWTLTNDNAEVLRRGAKTGFCFWDNYRYGSTQLAYYLPSTTSACLQRADGIVPMGLSAGWGDVYPSTIAFQYIDISGLPNGDYTITLHVDLDGDFVEADDDNNSSWARIRITRKGVTVLTQSDPP
jgi:hypothetical protein